MPSPSSRTHKPTFASADEQRARRGEEHAQAQQLKRQQQHQLKRRVFEVSSGPSDSAVSSPSHPTAVQSMNHLPPEELRSTLQLCIQQLSGEDKEEQYTGTRRLRELLTWHDPPVKQVLRSGILSILIELMCDITQPVTQLEAAWCITNIAASEKTEHVRILVEEHHVLECIVTLLTNAQVLQVEVLEQVLWSLCNVVGDSYKWRDRFLQSAIGLSSVLALLKSPEQVPLKILRLVCWLFANLSRGRMRPDLSLIRPILPVIANLFHMHPTLAQDPRCLEELACCLKEWSEDEQPVMAFKRIESIFAAGLVLPLLPLLSDNNLPLQVLQPLVALFGNLVTGTDLQTDILLEMGLLKRVKPLLRHPDTLVRRKCCWLLGNLMAGTTQQIQCVMDSKVIPAMVRMSLRDKRDIRVELTWAWCNAICGRGTLDQVQYLLDHGALESCCNQMLSNNTQLLFELLEALRRVLEHADPLVFLQFEGYGGVEALETLHRHSNDKVCELANDVSRVYAENVENSDDIDDHDKASECVEEESWMDDVNSAFSTTCVVGKT